MHSEVTSSSHAASAALQVVGLAKSFGTGKRVVEAVRGVDFKVDRGQIFGFLGPNGAGKSTTIRMIVDLLRPTSGHVRVFGEPIRSRPNALRQVGALVEGAQFYEHLTGRRNLEVLARTRGRYCPDTIEELLEKLDMSDRADRRVGEYSMGMKQRLGVVAALLDRPRLVILDEPTNGLDPSGIREMRSFIRQLADRDGLTVFLSSHLLAEVEQICDHLAIIHRGRIVRRGHVASLLAEQKRLVLDVSNPRQAAAALETRWPVELKEDDLWLDADREATPEVLRTLAAAEIDVYEARREQRTLEDIYMEATEDESDA